MFTWFRAIYNAIKGVFSGIAHNFNAIFRLVIFYGVWNFIYNSANTLINAIAGAFRTVLDWLPLPSLQNDFAELWTYMATAYSSLNKIIPCDVFLEILLFLFTFYVAYLAIKVTKYLIDCLLAIIP